MSPWTPWCSRTCDYMVRSTLLCFFGLWWPSGHESQESSLFMILGFFWSWEFYFYMDLGTSFKYILVWFESSTGVQSNVQVDIKNQWRTQKLISERSASGSWQCSSISPKSSDCPWCDVCYNYIVRCSLFSCALVALRARISGIQLICDFEVLLNLRIVFAYGPRDTT